MTLWYMAVLSLSVVLLLALAAIVRFVQINRQLQASEQRFRSVFDTSPTVFIVSDFGYRITHWNHAATCLFGWTAEEAIGQSICELLVPEAERDQVYKVVMDAQAQGHTTHLVNSNLDREGNTLICEWFNATYLDDQGMPCGVLSQGVDITEREHAREKLEEAKRLSDQLLADQQQFIAMISHEFRSPLAIIDAASQVLEIQCHDFCQVSGLKEVVSRIRRGVKRLTGFIDSCLAQDRLNRLEQHGLKPAIDTIVLSGFLQSIAGQAKLNAPDHDIRLQSNLDPASVLHADPSLIRILLHNLLGNACKYSPKGAVITLQVETLDRQHLLCCIGDVGTGIAETDQPHLKTAHFRGENAKITQGSGLGLFLCQRIVDLHEGALYLESSLGVGTLAFVTLPGLAINNEQLAE